VAKKYRVDGSRFTFAIMKAPDGFTVVMQVDGPFPTAEQAERAAEDWKPLLRQLQKLWGVKPNPIPAAQSTT
jgi:hypothetical protein